MAGYLDEGRIMKIKIVNMMIAAVAIACIAEDIF